MASGRSLLLLILTVVLLLLIIDRGSSPSHTLVAATTPGPFDLEDEEGLRAAVAAVGSELVLLTTNAGGLTSAVNMALQLRRVGLTAVLVLADRRSTCGTAHASWPWLRCGGGEVEIKTEFAPTALGTKPGGSALPLRAVCR